MEAYEAFAVRDWRSTIAAEIAFPGGALSSWFYCLGNINFPRTNLRNEI